MIESSGVNANIRKAVQIIMIQRDLTREDLAAMGEVTPEHVARMLSAKSGGIPKAWEKILEGLGLEVVVAPKGKPTAPIMPTTIDPTAHE